jgi:leader peptidase (prepilin peptidase) / N-methyltransferase
MTPQIILEYLFAAAQGGVMGSFIGVVVNRVPPLIYKASDARVGALTFLLKVSWPRSHCQVCHSPVHLWDMVPIFSYIALRGRCKDCGAAIGLESAVLELVGIAIGMVSVSLFGWSSNAVLCFVALSVATAVFAVSAAVKQQRRAG